MRPNIQKQYKTYKMADLLHNDEHKLPPCSKKDKKEQRLNGNNN